VPVGRGTRIWNQAQVREGASIGSECILGKGCFVDAGVGVGNRCKLENGSYVFTGYDLEDGVFLGPGSMLLNDKHPRAVNPDGSLKSAADWKVSGGRVGQGASIGGGAIVLPGVSVGRFALVGSGAVVTRDVPDHGIVSGNPARLRGFACACGHQLEGDGESGDVMRMRCPSCGRITEVSLETYRRLA